MWLLCCRLWTILQALWCCAEQVRHESTGGMRIYGLMMSQRILHGQPRHAWVKARSNMSEAASSLLLCMLSHLSHRSIVTAC